MSKKVVKKILPKAKKEIKTKKPTPKVNMTEELVKKKKNSQKILTAEGWKRRTRKTVVKKT